MTVDNKTLYFWFGQPPKVEVGAYNYVSYHVKKTYYICLKDYPEERKALNWGSTDYGAAELIILPNKEDARLKTINTLLDLSEECEHIICGIAGPMANIICPILKKRKQKFIVVSERPRIGFSDFKSSIISVGLYLKYGVVKRLKYQTSVKAFLPLGLIGVNVFRKLGWKKDILYRFMYCGEYQNYPTLKAHDNGKIRFLYIGRFGFNHALDVLMDAFDKINNDNWQLDMAGGYGEQKDIIMQWINHKRNVRFIGKIDSSEVRNMMAQYDCIVVPSRLDGWNCQINEALSIGCPVITHLYSVSSELVSASGAGVVIQSLDSNEMAKALEIPIKDEGLIAIWREKALSYRHRFDKEVVGEYLLDIINYVNNEIDVRPVCPW